MQNSYLEKSKNLLRRLLGVAMVLALSVSMMIPVFGDDNPDADSDQGNNSAATASEDIVVEPSQDSRGKFEEKIQQQLNNPAVCDSDREEIRLLQEKMAENTTVEISFNLYLELFDLQDRVNEKLTDLIRLLEEGKLLNKSVAEQPLDITEEIWSQFCNQNLTSQDQTNQLGYRVRDIYECYKNELILLVRDANQKHTDTENLPVKNDVEWGISVTYRSLVEEFVRDIQGVLDVCAEYNRLGNDLQEVAACDDAIPLMEKYNELKPLIVQTVCGMEKAESEMMIFSLDNQIKDIKYEARVTDMENDLSILKGTVQEQTAMMKDELSSIDAKLLFGYAGLAIGVLSLIVSIIAIACGLRKQNDISIDLSATASREDAEKLADQNVHLRKQNELTEKRVDRLQTSLADLEKKVEKMNQHAPKPEHKGDTVLPEPRKEPTPISNLALQYKTINPASSYLTSSIKGKYELYSDNTLSLTKTEKGKVNSLASWSGSGLLYLFNAVIDGVEYSSEKTSGIPGTYQIVDIETRATVRSSGTGDQYVLKKRGRVILKRI